MNIHHHEFRLVASEVDSRLRMPLSSLVVAIIDIATAHANRIGVGYDDMMKTNSSWVLSRLAIDITEMPRLGEDYRMSTWITGISRLFSDRCFELRRLSDDAVVVSAHSVWMAIDMTTRRPADLSALNAMTERILDRPCACLPASPLRPLAPEAADYGFDYTVKVSDIDVNRHLTTRRYIDLLVDLYDLPFYESHAISRFEIAFKREVRYGETVAVSRGADGAAMIASDPASPNALSKMIFSND